MLDQADIKSIASEIAHIVQNSLDSARYVGPAFYDKHTLAARLNKSVDWVEKYSQLRRIPGQTWFGNEWQYNRSVIERRILSGKPILTDIPMDCAKSDIDSINISIRRKTYVSRGKRPEIRKDSPSTARDEKPPSNPEKIESQTNKNGACYH